MQGVQKRTDLRQEFGTSGSISQGRVVKVSLPCEPWNNAGSVVTTVRDDSTSGIAELVPPPRIVPIVINPSQPVPVDVIDAKRKAPLATKPMPTPRHRHDPAVWAARSKVRELCDGTRTVNDIAKATGINRRTVVDHLKALNMKALKGIPGAPVEAEKRQKSLARRAHVKVMVAEGKSGPDIAAYLGVKVSTIHADCVALGIRIPKGTGRISDVTRKAREAALVKRQEQARQDKIAKAQADFEKATEKAVAALKALGVGRDDIAERLRAAVRGITA